MVECVPLAAGYEMGGLNNLPGGHATPPLPAIVGSLQLSFHGLADDREIILRSIAVRSYAEEVADTGSLK
jgi:hypothetical protein